MVRLACIQMSFTWDLDDNLERAEAMVRQAAGRGANLILLPELLHAPYFCQDQDPKHFDLAFNLEKSPPVLRMRNLAQKLGVVLPVSFFESAGQTHFNSVAVIDADGAVLGTYRKSHIPDGPGYQEKFYFSPGDTGFKVWRTKAGAIGVGICWDQWFPEAARAMMLKGADLLLYPTAIGSEPQDPSWDSSAHWQRVMQGHAAANLAPLAAANRYGREKAQDSEVTFYGSSFIAGPQGEILQKAEREGDAVLVQEFDLTQVQKMRAAWGVFRDRRPDLYANLITLDGSENPINVPEKIK